MQVVFKGEGGAVRGARRPCFRGGDWGLCVKRSVFVLGFVRSGLGLGPDLGCRGPALCVAGGQA